MPTIDYGKGPQQVDVTPNAGVGTGFSFKPASYGGGPIISATTDAKGNPIGGSAPYLPRNPALGGGITPPMAPGPTPPGAPMGGAPALPSAADVAGSAASMMTRDMGYAANPGTDPNISMLESDLKKTIDAINARFDSATGDQSRINNANYAAGNASNAESGNMGSPFGAANLSSISEKGKAAIDALNAQREEMLAGVTSQVDQLKIQEEQARQAAANTDMSNYLQILDQVKTAAQSSVATIATSGMSYDDFVAAGGGSTYNSIKSQLGMDDTQMKSLFVSKIPKAQLIGTPSVSGRNVTFFTQDPATGKISSVTIDAGVNLDPQTQPFFAPNGTMMIKNPDLSDTQHPYIIAPGTSLGEFAAFKSSSGVTYNSGTGQSTDGGSVDVTIPGNSLAAQNNNPGNLRFNSQPGATLGAGGFAKFASANDGFNALVQDITAKITGQAGNPIPDGPNAGKPLSTTSSLEDMIRVYAPTADHNDPVGYAKQVADAMGIKPTDQIGNLSAVDLAANIAKKESSSSVAPRLSDMEAQVEGIKKGTLAPPNPSVGRSSVQTRALFAQLEREGVDVNKMFLDYQAALKTVNALNGPQMVRFRGLATSVVNTINEVNTLADQMDLSGITPLNNAELKTLVSTAGNTQNGQLAAKYLAAVNTLQEEFANLANGGYAPTEDAWRLAQSQINSSYGVDELKSSLVEVQRLINYRVNALEGVTPLSPGGSNQPQGGGNDPLGILGQ